MSVVPSLGPPPVPVPSWPTRPAPRPRLGSGPSQGRLCRRPISSTRCPSGSLDRLGSARRESDQAPYGSTITMVPSLGPCAGNGAEHSRGPTATPRPRPPSRRWALARRRPTPPRPRCRPGRSISTNPASGAPAPYGSAVTVTVSIGATDGRGAQRVWATPWPRPPPSLENAGLNVSGAPATQNGVVRAPIPPSARSCRWIDVHHPAPQSRPNPPWRIPFDPACDLCEAAHLSEWHHEDDVCWVADCEVCGVPMVVWKPHGPTRPTAIEHMMAAADRGGRRPIRPGWVVDRPGHAPDPQSLPRPRTRPELVVRRFDWVPRRS